MFHEFLAQTQHYIANVPIMAFIAVYVAGVAVSFTPCVYPVIPITLAYIGGHSIGDRRKAITLSVMYVLGMAVVYTALGLFASLTGSLFGSISSHPVTLILAANFCLLLGLSLLDVFQLPTLGFTVRRTAKPGGYGGAFMVGMGSGLIVGPCTAPALGAILVYVAKQGNVVYGGSLLFTFAIGIGTLFLLLGTFTGLLTSLPKSGAWLNVVKKGFGWVLIAIAEFLFIQAGGRLP